MSLFTSIVREAEVIFNFLRPEELKYLKGDSSKIRALGWTPEYTFETMMDEMIAHWLIQLKN